MNVTITDVDSYYPDVNEHHVIDSYTLSHTSDVWPDSDSDFEDNRKGAADLHTLHDDRDN